MKTLKIALTIAFVYLLSFQCLAQMKNHEEYDKQWPFSEGYARVMRNVDFNGYKIPLYGFINPQGEEVIPLKYDYAEDFCGGIALVGKLSKAEYNNDQVTLVLQPRYTYVSTSGNELKYCFYFASSANKMKSSVLLGVSFIPYGLYNEGRLDRVKWQYKEISIHDLLLHDGYQDGLGIPTHRLYWQIAKDNADFFSRKYNLSDKFSTYYVRDYYYRIDDIDDGFFINDDKMIEQVVDSIEDKYIIVCQHGLCGVRNANSGEILIPCAFGDVVWIGKDKFAVEYNRKWAIYNSQMENLSGFVCDKIKPLDGKYITDTEHWVAIGEIESRFTYEWGYKYNYKWLSVDVEKLNKKH